MKRQTSAESAAAFLSSYQGRRKRIHWRIQMRSIASAAPPERKTQQRVFLDLAPATYAEILDCVETRIKYRRQRHQEIEHITKLALKMLHEAKWRPVP